MSVREIGLCRRSIGFFLEGRYFHDFPGHGFSRVNVAVAGLWARRGDADGDDGIRPFRHGERLPDGVGESIRLQDQGVGRGHDDVGRGIALGDLPAGVGDAGRRIPGLRLRQDLVDRDVRQLFPDDVHILLGGDHPELVRGTHGQEALHRQLDERLPHPEDVDELLRAFRCGKRPQAASDAAGHNYDMRVHYNWSIKAFICGTLA